MAQPPASMRRGRDAASGSCSPRGLKAGSEQENSGLQAPRAPWCPGPGTPRPRALCFLLGLQSLSLQTAKPHPTVTGRRAGPQGKWGARRSRASPPILGHGGDINTFPTPAAVPAPPPESSLTGPQHQQRGLGSLPEEGPEAWAGVPRGVRTGSAPNHGATRPPRGLLGAKSQAIWPIRSPPLVQDNTKSGTESGPRPPNRRGREIGPTQGNRG